MNDVRDFSVHRAALTHDINVLLADVQAFLRDAAAEAGDQTAQTREQFKARLGTLQSRLQELQAQGRAQFRDLAQAGDEYAHAHPWRVLGAGVAIGAACGALSMLALGRRG
ncbi:DUF883 family protein [Cupriavidus basilensis]|uniref:DUF883 family protein n=1 Tax=Cupriavidus basilensis TaxID=68895 RepID=A0ABT6ALE2_9BURK|nr:DUF883 family protein [Cupriavidus basilensis]MDF3833403.1 DUF883 family protein [Cupriavidus basilensis]